MLTIFSAPKPFRDEHVAVIQRNAILSWKLLGTKVQVILIGEEHGLKAFAEAEGLEWITTEKRTEGGTPQLDEIFHIAQDAAKHTTLCYINADIILLDDFVPTVERVGSKLTHYLIVGTRWDLDLRDRLNFETGWQDQLRTQLAHKGTLHRPMGSDYFVFPRGQMRNMPPFALGRAGWDNWMIFHARRDRVAVIDASNSITAVHQNHDYSHLPGGQPHYRHPESTMNIHMAGGQETMFRLRDADWIASPDAIQKKTRKEWEWPRKVEADLIARWGPGKMARAVRLAFHPKFAVAYLASKFGISRKAGLPQTNHPGGEESL